MSCRICGRYSCTESFHSADEIKTFDELSYLDNRELIRICIDLQNEKKDLEGEIDLLEQEVSDLEEEKNDLIAEIRQAD